MQSFSFVLTKNGKNISLKVGVTLGRCYQHWNDRHKKKSNFFCCFTLPPSSTSDSICYAQLTPQINFKNIIKLNRQTVKGSKVSSFCANIIFQTQDFYGFTMALLSMFRSCRVNSEAQPCNCIPKTLLPNIVGNNFTIFRCFHNRQISIHF